jgi:hypothetical protein
VPGRQFWGAPVTLRAVSRSAPIIRLVVVSALSLSAAACGDSPRKCNGSAALCERRYDEIAYATTHNAYNADDEGFSLPNQTYGVTKQLEDGVRGLMLDIYDEDGDVLVYHGYYSEVLGYQRLADVLAEITRFLESHPNEVVTIIFETYSSPETTLDAFVESGAIEFVATHAPEDPWPTLAEMIELGERLVVFTDKDGGAYDWYMPVWDHARETPYAASTPDELSCVGGRGEEGAALLIFNHFLTGISGSPSLAAMINFDPFLGDRVAECEAALMQKANFITVDFYEIGDTLAVTKRLNASIDR